MRRYGLYVDGQWTPAGSGKTFEVYNPATGDVVGEVADASKEDVLRAVDAAHRAFPGWAAKTAKERSEILRRAYDLMVANLDELAVIMTTEQGKPLAEAKGEIQYAADFVLWYSEEAKRVYGETIPASFPHKRILVLRQPVGVVAAITPWNFPAAMITRKIAPALAAGCTVIVKPAKQTPLTACRLVEIFEEAGMPPGVVNLITGSRAAEIADTMLADERVRKITFTGSTEVGKQLMRKAADTVKHISLELGGHAPFLVFEDADIDAAAREVAASKFRNAGQTCVCTNRVYVHESIAEPFAEALAKRAAAMKVGNGLEEGVVIGPLIDRQAAEKVEEHVRDAVQKGARVVTGGHRLSRAGTKGEVHFFEPTVLLDVSDDMLVLYEETFGPVAPVQTFRDDEEAVRKANDTRYGLAAYLFTRDLSRAVRVAESLEYGIVGINDGLPSVAQAPFGGFKESGLGREGGRHGIEEFLEIKYVSLALV
ncbi:MULTISPECIES: NAD-dependent succinate-semialdehyde dehydrogenase [Kyrpidia]|uniref:Succinate-semialdehyde dehydrogenase n=1 Tax=Kyrpidia spormannii TaxID=2055160 RepID=A0A6F9E308_9BACL|nr:MULTISPECIES: NAD-dependent succinate-semialdehyde dehydrogenase [Kyrpidia]CAB3391208.1 succinate-semialdehyde dehydrogenase [Kyrpidia spormannii]HHY68128.1 NAD-dependent succinate-semialdehyde dehydrogenase [Alicyclobacillus sp.]